MPEESKSKLIEFGRWIAVLPFGLLCGILVLFPLHWILYFTLVKGSVITMPVEDLAPIERFISPVISSIFFIYAGAMIAPKKQFVVSIVLFVLGIFIRLGIVFYVNQSAGLVLDTSLLGLAKLSLSALAGALGVLFVHLKTKE